MAEIDVVVPINELQPAEYLPTNGLEQWRVIQEFPKYQVSDYGNIRNIQTQKLLKFQLSGPYRRVSLFPTAGNKSKHKFVHCLVALAFCRGRTVERHQVDHIDKNPINNRACNLKWATRAENLANRAEHDNRGTSRIIDQLTLTGILIKSWDSIFAASLGTQIPLSTITFILSGRTKNPTRYQWRYHVDEDLPNENWRTITVKNIEFTVSNFGRINVNGRKSYGHLEPTGYRSFRSIGAHVVTATAFVPNPNNLPIPNHIDGNKQNNVVTNLIWATSGENTRHAVETGLLTSMRPVRQLSPLDGSIIATFPSVSAASRAVKTSPSNIISVCKNTKYRSAAGGFYWQYVRNDVAVFDTSANTNPVFTPAMDEELSIILGEMVLSDYLATNEQSLDSELANILVAL